MGKMDSQFIWHMEEVLDFYERPYDKEFPVICFDERPCQLIGDVLVPLPVEPGKPLRQDYHYERKGTCVILLAVEPLSGRRIVEVRKQKTKADYAEFMKKVAGHYGNAKKIILIQGPCPEAGGNLKGESPKMVFLTTTIHKNRRFPNEREPKFR
jgi:hypothetical protein